LWKYRWRQINRKLIETVDDYLINKLINFTQSQSADDDNSKFHEIPTVYTGNN